MDVPSNILTSFSKHAGNLYPEDGRITVDPDLQVVTELPQSHIEIPPSSTRSPNQSFIVYGTIFKANSGGTTNTGLAILVPGVWKIRLTVSFGCTYTDAAGVFSGVAIGDSFFNVLGYLALIPTVVGAYAVSNELMYCTKEDRYLWISSPGNTVGQTSQLGVTVSCDRVL